MPAAGAASVAFCVRLIVAVVVAQFGLRNRLPKSIIVLPFTVVICVLFMAVAMLYLEGLRALSGVLTTLGTL